MNIRTSWSRFERRLWLGPLLAAALSVGCAVEAEPPSNAVGGGAGAAGVGGGAGGSAGVETSEGGAGSTGATGGAGGSSGGKSGTGGKTSGGAGGTGAGGETTAGAAGGGGSSGGAGEGAGGTGAEAGSGGDGAGMSGAGGAMAGGGGAGGADAGSSGAGGGAGVAGASGAAGFQPCPASGPCIILPFGDSITDGFGTGGGYRIELFRRARADGHDITYVGSLQNGPNQVDGVTFPRRHEGHSGWRIAQLVPLIPSPAFDTIPHVVLLMIGTNDVNNNDSLAQAPARLGNLLDEIVATAPEALVVVAKITPLSSRDAQVRAYNDAIPEVVASRVAAGKHLIVVDQYTDFPLIELVDGVHPSTDGYARMAGVWYRAIEPYLR